MKKFIRLLFAVNPVAVEEDATAKAVRMARVEELLSKPGGDKTQYFELYKLIVASSEALVGRRQTVNTYFVTVNGLLATATGLLLQKSAGTYLTAISLAIISLVGIAICIVWRLVLISFGQLNRGKFAVINTMERQLAASVYDAEWEALGKGEDPALYRSFTEREAVVPAALLVLWVTASIVFVIVVAVAA